MPTQRRSNPGPSAAARNRRALIAAARSVFADGGIDAPLSAVARTAGVGQGSLYRHFPDRIDLALAVIEQNVADIEHLASDPTTSLDEILEFVTEQSIDSMVFVDLISASTDDPRLDRISERVGAAIATKLDSARSHSLIASDIDEDDLLLAVGLVANLVARVPSNDRRSTADQAWALLRRGISGQASVSETPS